MNCFCGQTYNRSPGNDTIVHNHQDIATILEGFSNYKKGEEPSEALQTLIHGDQFLGLNDHARVKIALGIAQQLKYLHDREVVHGSVLSCNVKVYHDSDVQLVDEYISPESGAVSKTRDVQHFGRLLWELLTGCKPNMVMTLIGQNAKPKLLKEFPDCDKMVALGVQCVLDSSKTMAYAVEILNEIYDNMAEDDDYEDIEPENPRW